MPNPVVSVVLFFQAKRFLLCKYILPLSFLAAYSAGYFYVLLHFPRMVQIRILVVSAALS